MNYVGQLAGQVFVQVKELYRGLNPATLSGCIDVIVVRQPDGSLQCSPFHVRFGKMGVLRSREKVVDIEINGEPVSLHMKLGENGEAFFVKETENKLVTLVTSVGSVENRNIVIFKMCISISFHASLCHHIDNIPCSSLPVQSLLPQQGDGGMTKKRRKRRRKARPEGGGGGGGRREESGEEFSEDEDMFTIDLSTDEEREALSLMILNADCHFTSSPDDSRSSTPKSDSELTNQTKDNPEMLWTWGELPQAAQVSTYHAVLLVKLAEFALGGPPLVALWKFMLLTMSLFLSISSFSTVFCSIVREVESVGPLSAEMEGLTASSMSVRILPDHLEAEGRNRGSPIRRTDSPSKRKEKRSQHLGADGIYLDDITELEPEVAALYFPKRYGKMMMVGVRSANQSPQSVGSSGMDSGVDSLSDQMGDLPHVAISLCGGLTDNKEITKEQFLERAVSYQQFSENPSLIDDPNLVVKIGNKYYNWNTAAPVMLAMQVYQKPLPQASVENIMKEKMPKKGGRWWFSWRSKNSDSKSVSTQIDTVLGRFQSTELGYFLYQTRCLGFFRLKDESSSSDEDHRSSNQVSGSCQSESLDQISGSVCYKKTLRLTSEQLASLQLKEGPNDVVFSVTTQYQGTCRCHGTIYLWSWDDKIIISDIDGTITRSDTLGHILPTLGKDWTHQGIARLYHKVSLNGYKFMYCSARAIGMADMTRGYLHWVNERGTMLPMGPVLLSPSSLFSALHREVIEKKPEKFKIECLTDIKHLFYPNTEPFYAAFGNRATDVYSYKEVGVPLNRIFTVNPKGELIQEHAKTNISSYGHLCDMVDHVFPVLVQDEEADFHRSEAFDQCNYWNKQLPGTSQEEEEEPQPIETS
uniref:phosphatidate phosphatase n=1 Tax=Acanthochromis polyacanthus TaxID=80966 RepID=A0A3Q1H3S5_9TELE